MTQEHTEERKRVTITLPERVHEMGKLLASRDRRDFSHFIEVLVEKHSDALQDDRKPETQTV